MARYEERQKAKDNLNKYRLYYKITSEGYAAETNEMYLEKMKEALDAVGVWLDVKDGELYLSIYPEKYIRAKDRNAGRRKKYAWNPEQLEQGRYECYKYSDIVFMMQTMKDQEIAEKIGMPIATFYRHKKDLKNSSYFQSLDLNRLRDKEYLDSVMGNYGF